MHFLIDKNLGLAMGAFGDACQAVALITQGIDIFKVSTPYLGSIFCNSAV